MKKKKASPIWLIIFLCLIIIALVLLINSVRYNSTVDSLTGEIQRLNKEIEEIKEFPPESMPSTSPSSAPISSPSAILKPKISTFSGEKQ